jgi:hypothetical protein
MPLLNKLYREYSDRAHFLLVYIREAHPTDGWRTRSNEREGIDVKQPRTVEERSSVAKTCAAQLEIAMPIVIDGLDNAVEAAYSGWPDRIAVVGKGGKLVYYGDKGPRGFDPLGMQTALKAELSRLAALQALEDALKPR